MSYDDAIRGCRLRGEWGRALRLLDEMRAADVAPGARTYTAAIAVCAAGGQPERALALLREMPERGLKPTLEAYTAVISAGGTDGGGDRVGAKRATRRRAAGSMRIDEAAATHTKALLEEMRSVGISPSAVSYSISILALCRACDVDGALALLREMQAKADSIEETTEPARTKSPRQRLRWDTDPSIRKWEPDVRAYTSLISAAGKAARPRLARELLDEMRERGVAPNAVTFTAAIVAVGRAQDAAGALALLDQMRAADLAPTEACLVACVEACAKRGDAGDADRALEVH